MPTLTLTLVELGTILALAIGLALLPGADIAKLALAVAYRKAGVSPAYAEAVQSGDVDAADTDETPDDTS